MHREFKELLPDATGVSGFVIAIFVDVRGFSSFARFAESSEAAIFLRRVYVRIMDDFFPHASFFKPTGDGLLIVIPYEAENLEVRLNESLQACMELVARFPVLCADDPMVNFEVPKELGAGIARGATTCLVSGGKKLDYSGRPLNLASRLMDLARPCGIVFDEGLGVHLLSKNLVNQFDSERVYLRGIAERTPIRVFYTKQHTVISAHDKQPIHKLRWREQKETLTMKEVKDRDYRFIYRLEQEPLDPQAIELRVQFPHVRRSGKKSEGYNREETFSDFFFENRAGNSVLVVNFPALAQMLEEQGVITSACK